MFFWTPTFELQIVLRISAHSVYHERFWKRVLQKLFQRNDAYWDMLPGCSIAKKSFFSSSTNGKLPLHQIVISGLTNAQALVKAHSCLDGYLQLRMFEDGVETEKHILQLRLAKDLGSPSMLTWFWIEIIPSKLIHYQNRIGVKELFRRGRLLFLANHWNFEVHIGFFWSQISLHFHLKRLFLQIHLRARRLESRVSRFSFSLETFCGLRKVFYPFLVSSRTFEMFFRSFSLFKCFLQKIFLKLFEALSQVLKDKKCLWSSKSNRTTPENFFFSIHSTEFLFINGPCWSFS